ncbi:unnamed protein product [Lampetra planeri]
MWLLGGASRPAMATLSQTALMRAPSGVLPDTPQSSAAKEENHSRPVPGASDAPHLDQARWNQQQPRDQEQAGSTEAGHREQADNKQAARRQQLGGCKDEGQQQGEQWAVVTAAAGGSTEPSGAHRALQQGPVPCIENL